MKFIIYKDRKGEYRWTLEARNGKKIADSAEGYKRKTQVVKMVSKITVMVGVAKVVDEA
jgi:uncharacterized protein YegP (UPF0339 family)